MTLRRARWAPALAGALALSGVVLAAPVQARMRDYWVAAVPATWNAVPSGHDAIMGMEVPASESLFGTVVYRRFSPGWKRRERNAPVSSVDRADSIPGPLLHARVGDRIRVHFKNLDSRFRRPHSMHFHGVSYRPSSDGSYVPGFSGPDGNVRFGQTWTYRLTAGPDSAGVWPYHDHSPSMDASLAGGLFGALSILRRHERPPDREFVVFFSAMGRFQTVDGRAFVGNTPVFRAHVGQRVQWDVLDIGDDFHTFHVHGHRWRDHGTPRDTRTLGPAESFRVAWTERDPGTWLYHCHVEQHMNAGMIGIYKVTRR